MPKTPTILTVFVASPDDVKEERAELGKVIQELNDTWGDHLGIRLELVRWETHAYPGLADDAQAVIKEEIPADYDIFVGIAWTRLGTPTKRGQSGTAEEFELAYKRFEDNPKQVRIMFYFKVKPVSPMELDLEQASRLEKFRQKLGEQGTLWWTFSELEDFRNFARIHLSRQVQTWGKSWGAGTALTPVKPTAPPETEPPADLESEEAEEGFLDLIETSVSSIERASETVTRINSATEELNGKITMKTARLQELNARADTGLAAKKRLINEVANDMEEFVARLKAEIPNYADSMANGLNGWAHAAALLPAFHPKDYNQLGVAMDTLKDLQKSTEYAIKSVMEFRQSVADTPPATGQYKRAKQHTLTVLDDLLNQIRGTNNLIPQVLKTIQDIIDSAKTDSTQEGA